MSNKHGQIEQRAREIWEREGRPEGRAQQHWQQAEEELAREGHKESAATSQRGSQPYVSATDATIEPPEDTPVVAGVSIPATPPVPTEELKKAQPASPARSGGAAIPKPADTAKSGPAKPIEEKKHAAGKKTEAEMKKGAAKKKG